MEWHIKAVFKAFGHLGAVALNSSPKRFSVVLRPIHLHCVVSCRCWPGVVLLAGLPSGPSCVTSRPLPPRLPPKLRWRRNPPKRTQEPPNPPPPLTRLWWTSRSTARRSPGRRSIRTPPRRRPWRQPRHSLHNQMASRTWTCWESCSLTNKGTTIQQ